MLLKLFHLLQKLRGAGWGGLQREDRWLKSSRKVPWKMKHVPPLATTAWWYQVSSFSQAFTDTPYLHLPLASDDDTLINVVRRSDNPEVSSWQSPGGNDRFHLQRKIWWAYNKRGRQPHAERGGQDNVLTGWCRRCGTGAPSEASPKLHKPVWPSSRELGFPTFSGHSSV